MTETDPLTRLSGGNPSALEKVPSARPAFKQMALTMIFTSLLAAVSMFFAIHDAVRAPIAVAVAAGLFWGAGILVTDRTLMLLGMGGSRLSTTTTAATRLVAAALIGVIVSTPLTLRIFASDISYEIGQTQLAQGDKNSAALAASPEKKQLDGLDKQIADWQDIRAGRLPATFASNDSATITQLKDQLADAEEQEATAQHTADQAAILYQCERYGGGRSQLDDPSKCAALPGPYGNAELYGRQVTSTAAALDRTQQQVAAVQRQIDGARQAGRVSSADKLSALQRQAPSKLRSLTTRHGAAQNAYDDLDGRLSDQNLDNKGLLAQLTALWRASEQQVGLMVAHLLLALLFVLIEFMPVLAKLMWQAGRTGRAYENAVQSLDAVGIARSEAARSRAQIGAETEYDLALVERDAEIEDKTNEAQHQREVLRIRRESAIRIERARADDHLSEQRRIDAEFASRRQSEMRRRAEAEHAEWVADLERADTVDFTGRRESAARSSRTRGSNRPRWASRRQAS